LLRNNSYLFSGLELFAVEAVEQKGKKQVEHHKISHHKCGQKNGKARFRNTLKIDKKVIQLVDKCAFFLNFCASLHLRPLK
jgi:hypothetical protein